MSYELDTNFTKNSGTPGVVLLDLISNMSGYDKAYSVIVDKKDNIIAAGYSQTNNTLFDFAIVKLDQKGDYVESFKNNELDISGLVLLDLSGGDYDIARSVAVDNSNNIIVAGYSGPNPNSASKDFAIVKLDQSGNYVKYFGSDLSGNKSDISGVVLLDFNGMLTDEAYSVFVDNNDNIIVAGYIDNDNHAFDFVIVKLDPSGNYVKSFGNDQSDISGVVLLDLCGNGISSDKAYSVIVDNSDNIIVAGSSYTNGSNNFAIVKIDPSGNYVQSFKNDQSDISGVVLLDLSGSVSDDIARSVVVDKKNNIIVAGHSDADSEQYDFAIVKLDQNGDYVESFKNDNNKSDISGVVLLDLSNNGYDMDYSVFVDSKDNIVVAGKAYDPDSSDDFAIVKLDQSGQYIESFGSDMLGNKSDIPGVVLLDLSGYDAATSVFVDSKDNIIAAGYSESKDTGTSDFVIVKLKYTEIIKNIITKKGFYIIRPFRISPYYTWLQKRNKKINQ